MKMCCYITIIVGYLNLVRTKSHAPLFTLKVPPQHFIARQNIVRSVSPTFLPYTVHIYVYKMMGIGDSNVAHNIHNVVICCLCCF